MALVFVGCKLPHGLRLELPGVPDVVLRGANSGKFMHLGYGITRVDGEFMARWVKQNAKLNFLKNNMIWVANTEADVHVEAVEMTNEKHGLEQLDPMAPPGQDNEDGTTTKIELDDDTKARLAKNKRGKENLIDKQEAEAIAAAKGKA
jgi:hypothetical protein